MYDSRSGHLARLCDAFVNCACQGRIIQCAQGARAHEAPPRWRLHHQEAVVKIVVLEFVTEVWLKCIETTTTKKGHQFYGQKIVEAHHQNSAYSAEIRPWCVLKCLFTYLLTFNAE